MKSTLAGARFKLEQAEAALRQYLDLNYAIPKDKLPILFDVIRRKALGGAVDGLRVWVSAFGWPDQYAPCGRPDELIVALGQQWADLRIAERIAWDEWIYLCSHTSSNTPSPIGRHTKPYKQMTLL